MSQRLQPPRVFIAYVEDQPGVLNRITSLLRRRNYNIVSLNVGRTHEPGVSRMTVSVEASAEESDRISANLYKLVNVLSVEDITDAPSVARALSIAGPLSPLLMAAKAPTGCAASRRHA